MKICFFLPTLAGGGAERCMLILANECSRKGYEVHLVLANAVGEYGYLIDKKITVISLSCTSVIKSIPRLRYYLKKEKPNVLLSTLTHANVSCVLAKILSLTSVRLILREANTPSIDSKYGWKQKVLSVLARGLYSSANYVVGVSEGVVEDLINKYKLERKKVVLIYNPTDINTIKNESLNECNHPWLVNKTTKVILAAGRFSYQKDFDTLLHSFALVRKKIDSRLIILGDGEDRERLYELAKKLEISEYCDFPGFTNEIFSFMRKSDVFVLSSRYEGLPGVLIQALICGCKVVSTDCPSGPREILHKGRFGDLVEIGNSRNMAKSILNSFNDKSRYSEDELNKYLAHNFSLETNTLKYEELFKR